MMQFQENAQTEGQTEGHKKGQNLFHYTLPATCYHRESKMRKSQKIAIMHRSDNNNNDRNK